MNISSQYINGNINGWDYELAQENFKLFGSQIPRYYEYTPVVEPTGEKRMLYEYVRNVLGGDLINIPQEIGDCVSWGGRNSIDYLGCIEITLNKDAEKYRPTFPPFFYGTSRVQIGGGRLRGDGSLGSWLEAAIRQYGSLFRDENNVPDYDGGIAKDWGRRGPPNEFLNIAKPYIVEATSLITSKEDAADSLWKGYPIAVCSNRGFRMEPDSQGFHQPSGTWGHCMTIIGFGYHRTYGLYFIILNSWGDVHGRLKDFDTGEDLPVGCLRVLGDVVDGMLRQNDSYNYSLFKGFPDNSQRLTKESFKLFGV